MTTPPNKPHSPTKRKGALSRRAAPADPRIDSVPNAVPEAPVLPTGKVLVGDATEQLRLLPARSVDCVITSPPYFRLRNYQHDGQLGMEATIDEWVTTLADVMVETRRVLKPGGTIWLNLGDSYSRDPSAGAGPKSLLLGPERLAVELVRRGFTIRNKVVWAKTNPMPSSTADRLSCTWEPIYLLAVSRHYWFDLDAIRVPHRTTRTTTTSIPDRSPRVVPVWQGPLAGTNDGLDRMKAAGRPGHALGKNPGDVWRYATSSFRGAHFATFPEKLIEPAVLAGCPERVCAKCGTPWKRAIAKTIGHLAVTAELQSGCGCGRWWKRGVILDPFMGAGTTAVVAERHRRDWIGIDINPDFARLTRKRIDKQRRKRKAAAPAPDQAAA